MFQVSGKGNSITKIPRMSQFVWFSKHDKKSIDNCKQT